MTDEDFQRLATLYLEDAIEPADLERLNQELSASRDRVREFNDLRLLAGLIHEHGRSSDGVEKVVEFQPKSPEIPLQRSWWSAAALLMTGLFVGCLGMSAVWAYNHVDTDKLKRIPLRIFNGGFESELALSRYGYPVTAGNWTGDQVEVVDSEHQGVPSFEGKRMLRFKQTWGESAEKRGTRANQWQLVNLAGIDRGDGSTLATLRARFNRIDAGPDTDTVFRIEVQAFSGDPSTAEAQYDLDTQISGAELKKSTDGDSQTWETLEVTTSVPPEADFLLIGFYAHEDVVDDPPTDPEFAGHYVDGVELELMGIKQ